MDDILAIWLEASIKAHDFLDAEFWTSQVANMRDIYLPASETYVYECDTKVIGFYSLYENSLPAIFVSPESQGQGTGKALLSHAKNQRTSLTLSVFQANKASYQFYLSQDFSVVGQQNNQHTEHPEFIMSTGI